MPFRETCLLAAALLMILAASRPATGQNTAQRRIDLPLVLVQTIPLPDITGSMNHLDADAKRERFFVTAPGQKKLVVVDLNAGKVLHVLEVSAAAARFIPELDQLCFAGGSGVAFFDGNSLMAIGKVDLGSPVDELQYDTKEKRLYAGVMDADKPSIAVIDVPSRKLAAQFKLPARPQGFVVEASGKRIYVNTPAKEQVTVIDRQQQSVVAEWKLSGARSNYPIALDEMNHRLFVACRRPAKLLVLDTSSGNIVDSVETGRDADDMAYDAANKRVYVTCGGGVITTVEQIDADHYRKLADVITADDVRNAQFVVPLKKLYVAVPPHDGAPAELRVYRPSGSTSNPKQTE
jgi:DNA-binding beta-propeller fold protein YncE